MNRTKPLFLILILFGWQSLLLANLSEITKLSEVGYNRNFSWDKEVVRVCIKCINGKIDCQIEIEKEGKIENKSHKLCLKKYLELWEYINANSILNLKSGAFLNGSLTDDEFFVLYKKIPRQYSYIYDFYFKIGNEKISFTVDDIGYIKDMRYLEVLNRINKLLKVKTEINFFGADSNQ